jgi:hypothetical protein
LNGKVSLTKQRTSRIFTKGSVYGHSKLQIRNKKFNKHIETLNKPGRLEEINECMEKRSTGISGFKETSWRK